MSWNMFIFRDQPYIAKTLKSVKYKVILSNFENIWTDEFAPDEIVEKCQALNPFINTDSETFINTVLSLIREVKSFEKDVNVIECDDDITLEFRTKLENAPFKFDFHLKRSDSSEFSKEIAVPMIQTIQLLELRQKELCNLLEKKDTEIQQHVFENGEIKRESVVTKKFDLGDFYKNTKSKLFCDVFSNSEEFNNIMAEKYGCTEVALLTVKKEKGLKKKTGSLAKSIIRHKKPKMLSSVKTKDE